MKKIHILIFGVLLFLFSMLIPYLLKYFSANIEQYEEVANKPLEKIEFKSRNPVYILRATDKNKWTYFSFSKGSEVPVTDDSSLDWDIAFKRTNFISNGGASNRKGTVSIVNIPSTTDLDAVTSAPDTGYEEDDTWFGNIRNKQLNKWYNYSTQYHRVESKGEVYVIKTSDGKYAKMKILYYYCAGGESGCIMIEYFYQPDGTKNLANKNETLTSFTN